MVIRLSVALVFLQLLSADSRASVLGVAHDSTVSTLDANSSGGGSLQVSPESLRDLAGSGLQDIAFDPVTGDLFALLQDNAGGAGQGSGATVLVNPHLSSDVNVANAPLLPFAVPAGSNISAYDGTLAIAHGDQITILDAVIGPGSFGVIVTAFRDLAGSGLQDIAFDPVTGDLFALLQDNAGGAGPGSGATVLVNPHLNLVLDATTAPLLPFTVPGGSNISAFSEVHAVPEPSTLFVGLVILGMSCSLRFRRFLATLS
ncbi:MAG: hypothetical protein DCC68_20150 [Planctomycetota bacterium]|nr:MAG: hypothetical protein DCC68_20150 [Planctomycetota bacterium]